MKSLFKLTILFVIILLGTTFCNKKPFKHVTVTGRVLSFLTGLPLSTGVSLTSVSAFSEELVHIGSSHTDANGYFKIHGNADRTNAYSLFIDQDSPIITERPVGKLKEGKTTDLGNFLSGSMTCTCKLVFVSDSGRCLQWGFSTFRAGIDTTLIISQVRTLQDSSSFGGIEYSTNDCYNTSNSASHFYTLSWHFTNEPILTYTLHY